MMEIPDRSALLRELVRRFLRTRPMFYALIRPQEACYLQENRARLESPILDFGCGDGAFLNIALEGQPVDLGIDLPTANPGPDSECVYRRRVTYDGAALPFADASIASVVSNSVLEHVSNVDLSVAEISRILKPGGVFLVSVMTGRWDQYLLGRKLLGDWYSKRMRRAQRHWHLLSASEWAALFEREGLEVIIARGYLSARVSRWLEVFHYLSVSSLLWKNLLGRWVLMPGWHSLAAVDRLFSSLLLRNMDSDPSTSAAVFFVLRRR